MKRKVSLIGLAVLAVCPSAWAVVVVNEVLVNPPGSGNDDTREFIELMGVPGKKLDGYAIGCADGTEDKYFLLGTIPPSPNPAPEIDEFFSLDGLSLGTNGLLVIGIGSKSRYAQLLDDTQFMEWDTIWNGGLDTPGKLNNDASYTILLVRNRPGATEADPANSNGLRWGKDIPIDGELFSPVESNVCSGDTIIPGFPCRSVADCFGSAPTCVPGQVDQYGDGNLDKAATNGFGGMTFDLKGSTTMQDLSDDLEVVDEVSYEYERGWEYDLDDRKVDVGSTSNGLSERAVHKLGDPQGFNPDVLVRVDYRTRGPGWAPAGGGIGDGPGGNNWQDTATEQWVRGEAVEGSTGVGGSPQFFTSNDANVDANAIQPYLTNVPLWLNDGVGTDYNFAAAETFQIMAGRVNPLAVAFIPGDSDRDGECDAYDIAKIAAVFGNDDWIFSNSFDIAPEGDEGDPATQTRPWDVDATGTNGIEASDLQWTLNFQGDATGRIVGVQYDSATPSATGVALNSSAGTACTVTYSTFVPSGRALNDLRFGDIIEMTVSGQVTGGANMSVGAQNGIMQFVHDVEVSAGGVVEIVGMDALSPFATTRSDIQILEGAGGDLGASSINGYSTSFSEGLGAASELYVVTFEVVGGGDTDIEVLPAGEDKFAESTPNGIKLGHTWDHDSPGWNIGNPASSVYPLAFTVSGGIAGDADGDGDVTLADFESMPACVEGPNVNGYPACQVFDFDRNDTIDLADYAAFMMQVN